MPVAGRLNRSFLHAHGRTDVGLWNEMWRWRGFITEFIMETEDEDVNSEGLRLEEGGLSGMSS